MEGVFFLRAELGVVNFSRFFSRSLSYECYDGMGLKRGSRHDRLYDLYDDTTTTTSTTAHCMGFIAWLFFSSLLESFFFSLTHTRGFLGLHTVMCSTTLAGTCTIYLLLGKGVLKTDIRYRSKGLALGGHFPTGQRGNKDCLGNQGAGQHWDGGSGRGAFNGRLG